MSTILGYTFDGPYSIDTNFNTVSGVYVIHDGDKFLDVGETGNLKERIPNHERKSCWNRSAGLKGIKLEFLNEADQQKRLLIEQDIRSRLNFSCGDR